MNLNELKKKAVMILASAVAITSVSIGTGVIARRAENPPAETNKSSDSSGRTSDKDQAKSNAAPEPDEKKETDGDADQKEEKQKEEKKELVLSSFEVSADSDVLRDKNLAIACEKLNGKEIKAGETLSFNTAIGPCTEAEGYVEGPIIVNATQLAMGVGGGVCQVSTALYNAAVLGNLEIIERHKHSFPVEYVPVGQDASVSDPDMDLKIKNTNDIPIQIEALAVGGKVNIRLLGAELPEGEEIRIKSTVDREIAPEGEEVRVSDELPIGETKVLQEGRTGYETTVVKEHYRDGKLIDQKTLSNDVYPAVQRIVLEGSSENK